METIRKPGVKITVGPGIAMLILFFTIAIVFAGVSYLQMLAAGVIHGFHYQFPHWGFLFLWLRWNVVAWFFVFTLVIMRTIVAIYESRP